MENKLAIYMRLSSADEDAGRGKRESDSIANQRKLINQFIDRDAELSKLAREEFSDDGYTGTNTDRPAFADMMERVKSGEFKAVIVKDFSRFSRDYIELGDCQECLFPFLGVRFISVNNAETTGGLDAAMRNFVYAAYSRDLSVKVTSALERMAEQGKFIGGFAPYGYVLYPAERNKLAPDQPAAAVVRRIFSLAADGTSLRDIARVLNAEGVPTPGEYFERKLGRCAHSFRTDSPSWSYGMISKIVKNPVYAGASAGLARRRTAPLAKTFRRQSPDERKLVDGTHEAIVGRAVFDAAQESVRKRKASAHTAGSYPLRSLVKCGACGRAMILYNHGKSFCCQYGSYSPHSGCADNRLQSREKLEKLVCGAIGLLLQTLDAPERPKKTESAAGVGRGRTKYPAWKRLELYERYASGGMSRETYLYKKAASGEKISGADEYSSSDGCAERVPAADTPEGGLTYALAHAFVEAAAVFPDGRVEITWKFRDIFGGT